MQDSSVPSYNEHFIIYSEGLLKHKHAFISNKKIGEKRLSLSACALNKMTKK